MHPRPIWQTLPLIRWLIPFIAGIFISCSFSPSVIFCFLGLFIALLGFCFFQRWSIWLRFKYYPVGGICLLSSILFAGMVITHLHGIRNHPDWYGHQFKYGDDLLISLTDDPILKNQHIRVEAEVIGIRKAEKFIATKGHLYFYFNTDSHQVNLKYGDRLWLRHPALQLIKGPAIPGEFDFRSYAATKNIFHQCYVKDRYWQRKDNHGGNWLDGWLLSLRRYIVSRQNQFIGEQTKAAAVANALLIGYKHDLDKDLLQAYADIGVVHVIAISGMHVALVNLILIKLLTWIRLSKHRFLALLINLSVLWGFALLTGASASVLRSAWMFSFISIGKIFGKEATVLQALAVSVFILLAFDPYLILDAGFLLSHLAVLGLLVMQKPIVQLMSFKNKWIFKIWELLAVTMAAQIFTLPLCLFYFHQFPNYFLLSNLFIIPLSTIILFGCILLMTVAEWNDLAYQIGKLLHHLIDGMNSMVDVFSHLPGASSKGLDIDGIQLLLLYFSIGFFCYWKYGFGKKYIFFSVGFLFCFFSLFIKRDILARHQKRILVFQQKGRAFLAWIQGDRLFLWHDDLDHSAINHVSVVLRDYFHVRESALFNLSKTCSFSVCGTWVYRVDSLHFPDPSTQKAAYSVVWLTQSSKINISEVNNLYHPDIILMDGTNKLWKIVQWQKDCDSLFLRHHYIPQDGPWVQHVE